MLARSRFSQATFSFDSSSRGALLRVLYSNPDKKTGWGEVHIAQVRLNRNENTEAFRESLHLGAMPARLRGRAMVRWTNCQHSK